MSAELRGKAAIVGFGDSYCTRQDQKTPLVLAAEAAKAAMLDAGLAKDDVDGVLTGRPPAADLRPQWNNIFTSYFKLNPTYSSEITIHAAGINAAIKHATMAVTTGIARFVLIVAADSAGLADFVKISAELDTDPEFEAPYDPILPSIYAQVACRLSHEYGVTEEDLAAVSVQCQDWAVKHPKSAKGPKGPITVEDVLNSRIISSPLRLWNCATWGPPGTGGALIITSAENARKMQRKPIYILGFGEAATHEYITDRMALRHSRLPLGNEEPLGRLPNITSTGCRVAARLAFEMAGVSRSDIDIVQTGSNFSHSQLMALSELGFTTLPESGDFIRSGATGPNGALPTNTNGGWLSFGQPGVSCVMDSLIEGVRQLRGEALGHQVEGVEVGLVHALGGMQACQSVTIMSTST